jgi:hypothetical protein
MENELFSLVDDREFWKGFNSDGREVNHFTVQANGIAGIVESVRVEPDQKIGWIFESVPVEPEQIGWIFESVPVEPDQIGQPQVSPGEVVSEETKVKWTNPRPVTAQALKKREYRKKKKDENDKVVERNGVLEKRVKKVKKKNKSLKRKLRELKRKTTEQLNDANDLASRIGNSTTNDDDNTDAIFIKSMLSVARKNPKLRKLLVQFRDRLDAEAATLFEKLAKNCA